MSVKIYSSDKIRVQVKFGWASKHSRDFHILIFGCFLVINYQFLYCAKSGLRMLCGKKILKISDISWLRSFWKRHFSWKLLLFHQTLDFWKLSNAWSDMTKKKKKKKKRLCIVLLSPLCFRFFALPISPAVAAFIKLHVLIFCCCPSTLEYPNMNWHWNPLFRRKLVIILFWWSLQIQNWEKNHSLSLSIHTLGSRESFWREALCVWRGFVSSKCALQ